jgi:hypothetical protein
MSKSYPRIYYGPDDSRSVSVEESKPAKKTVDVPLSELLATLVDAARKQRSWVDDFRDEEVTISTDLYEIILAYQHYRRPSA